MDRNIQHKYNYTSENSFFLTLESFFKDSVNETLKRYLKFFLRIGSLVILSVVCLYLILKFLFKWDVLYEKNFPFRTVFFSCCIIFFVLSLSTFIISFVLYNNKYVRHTKYTSKKGNNQT